MPWSARPRHPNRNLPRRAGGRGPAAGGMRRTDAASVAIRRRVGIPTAASRRTADASCTREHAGASSLRNEPGGAPAGAVKACRVGLPLLEQRGAGLPSCPAPGRRSGIPPNAESRATPARESLRVGGSLSRTVGARFCGASFRGGVLLGVSPRDTHCVSRPCRRGQYESRHRPSEEPACWAHSVGTDDAARGCCTERGPRSRAEAGGSGRSGLVESPAALGGCWQAGCRSRGDLRRRSRQQSCIGQPGNLEVPARRRRPGGVVQTRRAPSSLRRARRASFQPPVRPRPRDRNRSLGHAEMRACGWL